LAAKTTDPYAQGKNAGGGSGCGGQKRLTPVPRERVIYQFDHRTPEGYPYAGSELLPRRGNPV